MEGAGDDTAAELAQLRSHRESHRQSKKSERDMRCFMCSSQDRCGSPAEAWRSVNRFEAGGCQYLFGKDGLASACAGGEVGKRLCPLHSRAGHGRLRSPAERTAQGPERAALRHFARGSRRYTTGRRPP